MPIREVFPNPTVKQVIFQIRFPNLFFIESKIGDYQVTVMKHFPDSRVGVRRNILIADVGPEVKAVDIPGEPEGMQVQKIWSFRSPDGVQLNVQADSLDISSEVHKTYNNPTSGHRFRDIIQFSVDAFLAVAAVPVLKRVGLRYIDQCPVPARDDAAYREYYNTTFPLDRFALPDVAEMLFQVRARRGPGLLVFREVLKDEGGQLKLVLDFDGYAENVDSGEYLAVTDSLHDLVLSEYEASIKEPVYEHMRKHKE